MTFDELEEFKKDRKQLLKKYRSLAEDLETVKKVLAVAPAARPPFSFEISDLSLTTCVIKVKKIACKSLKGKGVQSGLRLIYALFKEESRITFIEIYHKSEQASENRDRIYQYFS